MTQLYGIYKCPICGNIVKVIHTGGGTLICCGQNMQLQSVNTVDASLEKHLPVIEKSDNEVIVKVGSIPHPMETEHYIEWIELTADDQVFTKYLQPGETPAAKFITAATNLNARIYCNLHGLWGNNS